MEGGVLSGDGADLRTEDDAVSASSAIAADDALLEVRNLSKSFPGTRALSGVDLDLRPGRVTALVGHNGSGKSTLVKVLAGIHRPDPGGTVHGAQAPDGSPRIHFIHQDLGLIDDLTTVENLDLSTGLSWRAFQPVRRAAEIAEAVRLLGRLGVQLDVDVPLRRLTAAQRTMVAIARALARWPDDRQVLVLDEPTAALQHQEADVVLDVVARIARGGAAVLYVSHRLDEVVALADDVLVLRDGQVVARHERGAFTAATLVDAITGELPAPAGSATVAPGSGSSVRFEVRGLTGRRTDDVSISVRAGEIVGVSGVIGSGVEELLSTVFGAVGRSAGQVLVDGVAIAPAPAAAVRAGIGFVPRDRHRHAAFMELSARENLTLPSLRSVSRRWGSIHAAREKADVSGWFTHAKIRPGTPQRPFAQFSGGNQQKVVLSRWLRTTPRALLLEDPTQGVDVGAQAAIYDLIGQAAAGGAAVVVASSDTKELSTLCHRVLVMSGGRIVAELSGDQLNERDIVRHTLSPQQR